LGFTFKKEANACEKCGAFNTDVGPMTHYQKHGYNDLLCKNCIAKIEEHANIKCPECDKIVGLDAMTEYDGKGMCQICVKKAMNKGIKSKERRRILKSNWFKIISIGLIGITILLGYLTLIK